MKGGSGEIFVVVFFSCLVCSSHALLASEGEALSETQSYQNYHPFENLTTPYIQFVDDVFLNLQENPNISSQCQNDTRFLIELVKSGDSEALKLLDATGKPSSGILGGGVSFPGYFSECLAVSIGQYSNSSESVSSHSFFGKYCLVTVNISYASKDIDIPHVSWTVLTKSQKKPTIGICIPSSCLLEDISRAANSGASHELHGSLADASVCYTRQSKFSKDVAAICVLSLFILFVVAALCATAYDIFIHYVMPLCNCKHQTTEGSTEMLCPLPGTPEDCKNACRCYILTFSLKSNAKKILCVDRAATDNIGALHGLRFLSMVLIIFGHTYSFATLNLFIRNPEDAVKAPKNFLTQTFANGTIAVDTFYFISGLLVAFVSLKAMTKNNGKLSLLYFYVHRFFRLTPLLMAVIAFCAVLLRYVGSGPNWLSSIAMYDMWCKSNWWTNFLYLQNFINTEQMCLSHSWYLATDMQFYLLTPLILIPLYKNFRYGVVALAIFFITTALTTAIITAINDYPAIPYINNVVPLELMNAYYKEVYIKPYCRMGPYLVGIATGYYLIHRKELTLKKYTVVFLWMGFLALGLTVIYVMWPANQGHLPTRFEAAAYSSLARSAWAMGLGWLIVACVYGYAGFINTILSWTPLVPLSRLTYCAYLVHPVVMNVYYGSTETSVVFSYSFMMYLFWGNVVTTYIVAFIFTLLFESPFIGLEKVILTRFSRSSTLSNADVVGFEKTGD